MPKSASTSLLSTLGGLYNIPSKQIMFSNNNKIKSINLLDKYHSDIRQIGEKEKKLFQVKDIIYKQHIFPTENNVNLLKDLKKVILLREPEEVVSSYYRSEKKFIHEKRIEFSKCKIIEEWIEERKKNGLYDDLNYFQTHWKKQSENNLIISYYQLIQFPKKTINNIERFWGLPITKCSIKLDKKKYTRITKPAALVKLFVRKTSRDIFRFINSGN